MAGGKRGAGVKREVARTTNHGTIHIQRGCGVNLNRQAAATVGYVVKNNVLGTGRIRKNECRAGRIRIPGGSIGDREITRQHIPLRGAGAAALASPADGEGTAGHHHIAVVLDHHFGGARGSLGFERAVLDINISHNRDDAGVASHQPPAGAAGVHHPDIAADGVAVQVHIKIGEHSRGVEGQIVIILSPVRRRTAGDAGEQRLRAHFPGGGRHAAFIAGVFIHRTVGESQGALHVDRPFVDHQAVRCEILQYLHGGRIGNFKMDIAAAVSHIGKGDLLGIILGKYKLGISRRGVGIAGLGIGHKEVALMQIPGGGSRSAALGSPGDRENTAGHIDVAVLMNDEGGQSIAGALGFERAGFYDHIAHDGNRGGIPGRGRCQPPAGTTGIHHPNVTADGDVVQPQVFVRDHIRGVQGNVIIILIPVVRRGVDDPGQQKGRAGIPGADRDASFVAGMLIGAAVIKGQRSARRIDEPGFRHRHISGNRHRNIHPHRIASINRNGFTSGRRAGGRYPTAAVKCFPGGRIAPISICRRAVVAGLLRKPLAQQEHPSEYSPNYVTCYFHSAFLHVIIAWLVECVTSLLMSGWVDG